MKKNIWNLMIKLLNSYNQLEWGTLNKNYRALSCKWKKLQRDWEIDSILGRKRTLSNSYYNIDACKNRLNKR